MSWLAPNSHWSSFQRSVTQSFQHLEVETAVYFFFRKEKLLVPRELVGWKTMKHRLPLLEMAPFLGNTLGVFLPNSLGFAHPKLD